jgi:hypothetical protein
MRQMFNPFLTQGQLQSLLNQQLVRSMQPPSIPSVPSMARITPLAQSVPGGSDFLNSVLTQVVINAFKNR